MHGLPSSAHPAQLSSRHRLSARRTCRCAAMIGRGFRAERNPMRLLIPILPVLCLATASLAKKRIVVLCLLSHALRAALFSTQRTVIRAGALMMIAVVLGVATPGAAINIV